MNHTNITQCTDTAQFLGFLHRPGDVFEIRIPKCPERSGGTYTSTAAGWFNDPEIAAKEIKRIAAVEPPGIYVTINPVKPELMGVSCNKIQWKTKSTTADQHILERRWLLVDIDPTKPSPDISATDGEMQAALALGLHICETLEREGWPAPLYGMSGNGCYLLFRIELPNDEPSTLLVKNVLQALAARFDTDHATVDKKTFNASRICAVFGTVKRKGDDLRGVPGVEDRPHRMTWFEPQPCELNVVTNELLEAMAATAPKPKQATTPQQQQNTNSTRGGNIIDRARKYIATMGPAISGQGGHTHTFNVARTVVCGFAIDENQAMQIMAEWNQSCSPPWDDKDLQRKIDEAMKSSGERGYLLGDSAEFTRRKKTKPTQAEHPSDDGDQPEIFYEEERTEAANGKRLFRTHGRDMRYISAWDSWVVWDGARWQADATCLIDAKAKEVAESLWEQYRALERRVDGDTRDEAKSFVKASNSANGIAHMINLSRSEPGIAITHKALDQSEMLLNVINGTIDLTTGMIRPHNRDDLITKQAPVVYDLDADCPTWLRFLRDVFCGDDELITFARRLVGYCLTGSTRDHILPFFYGMGANGKSVFTSIIMALLGGDYSMRSAPELLMAKGNETHPTERADLFGKRLVISNEIEAGKRLNEALVKDLTGGDAIRARRMREDFWEFQPTHKVWIVGNHKPVIRGTDNGIWRRVKLIPFNRIFTPDEQDKELPVKLMRELSGILNWAIAGCMEWQAEGLGEPEAVRQATAEYRDEQDIVRTFIDEKCIEAPAAKVKAAILYATYKQWAESCSERPIGSKTFGEEIGKRYHRYASNGTWYSGIGLAAE